jgi:hypothetical protein
MGQDRRGQEWGQKNEGAEVIWDEGQYICDTMIPQKCILTL